VSAAASTLDSVGAAHDQIVLGLIGVLGVVIAGLVYIVKAYANTKVAAQQATEANKAVNNIGPGEHRLYDVIARIEAKQDDFDKRWGNLPDGMDDAVGLVELLHGLDRRVSEIQVQLVEHVAWEMAVKYPKEG
jgi:hypothetical protein